MTTIYLARHGQNIDNVQGILNGHRDLPLTELGREQARTTATHIKELGLSFDKVYCSPLSRAKETAEIICDALHLPTPVTHLGIIERDFGVMSGRSVADIQELCAPHIIETDTITYFLSPEGAETFPDLISRTATVLEELKEKHKNESILLATHGDFGKMMYAAFYNLDWESVLTGFHFGNCELLKLEKGTDPTHAHVFQQEQMNH